MYSRYLSLSMQFYSLKCVEYFDMFLHFGIQTSHANGIKYIQDPKKTLKECQVQNLSFPNGFVILNNECSP